MKADSLTVDDLRLILFARLEIDLSERMEEEDRIQMTLFGEVKKKSQISILIEGGLSLWIAQTLANRLKQNHREIPPVSFEDFSDVFPLIFRAIEEMVEEKIDIKVREAIRSLSTMMAKSILEVVSGLWGEKNPYEECWRWISIVLELAEKRNILPLEIVVSKSASEEITRRMFSEEEFTILCKKSAGKLMKAIVERREKVINAMVNEKIARIYRKR